MTEIIPPEDNRNNLIIPTDKIPPAAWQAIYHHLTKKTESVRKLYSGAYEIEKSNIVDLIERLKQSIVGYGPQGNKIEITINLRKDSSFRFSSLEKFVVTDLSHKPSATKSIVVDFDFLICPPTEVKDGAIGQKYKVFCILDQDFFDDGDVDDDSSFFDDGDAGKNILIIVEYADYSIGRALQATADDWVNTLKKRAKPKFYLLMPKIIKWFRGSIPGVACLIAMIPFFRYGTAQDISSLYKIINLQIFVFVFVATVFTIFVGWSLKNLTLLQPTTYIMVTSGDRNRKSEIESKISKRTAILSLTSLGIILPFLIGTLSSIFASYLGSLS